MPPRFYAPDLDRRADRLRLAGDEARHLTRVLRLAPGTDVRVFDGRGLERRALVDSGARNDVMLRLGEEVEPAREVSFPLTLVQSLLKGDAMDAVVRDATMLGVTAVQPLMAARSEVPAAAVARGARRDRWQRIAVSSAKQCGRAVVPEIREPAALARVLEGAGGSAILVFTEPSAPITGAAPARSAGPVGPAGATVLVGPEGGWTADELEAASRAGASFLTLGSRTLRADAVALVALPVLLSAWGEL